MNLTTLEDLLLDQVKDVFDAEKQLTKALPKMAKAAKTEALREAFENHLEETQAQVERLEQVFELLDKQARGKKCQAMHGLIEEGAELIKMEAEDSVLDAGLICAAQKVEHYEIAAYGTLATWAKMLGHDDAASLFEATLAEEKAADEKLTELASEINARARHGGGQGVEEAEEVPEAVEVD